MIPPPISRTPSRSMTMTIHSLNLRRRRCFFIAVISVIALPVHQQPFLQPYRQPAPGRIDLFPRLLRIFPLPLLPRLLPCSISCHPVGIHILALHQQTRLATSIIARCLANPLVRHRTSLLLPRCLATPHSSDSHRWSLLPPPCHRPGSLLPPHSLANPRDPPFSPSPEAAEGAEAAPKSPLSNNSTGNAPAAPSTTPWMPTSARSA